MMIETILAVLAVVSFLSAMTMAMFAWKLNSDWVKFAREMNRRAEDEHAMFMVMMCGGDDDEEE